MTMPESIQLNLPVDVDVFTSGSAAEVVNAILESLLYQRNQIPFVYQTYTYHVNKWLEDEKTESLQETFTGNHSFEVQRQRNQAKMTKNAISAMREAISDSFGRQTVKCLRFLFGATTFTPRESYTVHIPRGVLAGNQCNDHHKVSPAKLNQALLSLLTNEKLYAIFSNNLNPTNLYMQLESFELPSSSRVDSIPFALTFPKEFYPLPASCKDIQIHLLPKCNDAIDDRQLRCNKELKSFEDVTNLDTNCVLDGSNQAKYNDNKTLNERAVWWESEIVVRGFKHRPIKGVTLWS